MNRPKVFITGVTGGIGQHLAAYLLAQGAEVYGLQRKSPDGNSPLRENQIHIGDLLDGTSLYKALDKVRPTHIYHLAGSIDKDITEGLINYETNVIGTIRLLNAVTSLGLTPKILIAGSSAVYGGASDVPLKEETELQPRTHYAVSKVAQEMVAIKYHQTCGLPIVRVRTFNVIGPGISPSLLCADLAQQIARAEYAGKTSIQVGNTQPRRDYTDVRDIVRAYVLLMQDGLPGEVYNVCSMQARSVQECLDGLLAQARIPLTVGVDESRFRAADIDIQVGDFTRIHNLTGWKPEIPFMRSLEDLLNDWRIKLQGVSQ
ncbi:MAG TPA: GDP-mannose 4,6-dehydratase [Blastocatellia bacterium]|nr:GDP-mannose 4,6-dehydratase [Blastocatellia bacterium]